MSNQDLKKALESRDYKCPYTDWDDNDCPRTVTFWAETYHHYEGTEHEWGWHNACTDDQGRDEDGEEHWQEYWLIGGPDPKGQRKFVCPFAYGTDIPPEISAAMQERFRLYKIWKLGEPS